MGNPGQQRQAGETDGQRAADKAAVGQYLTIVAPQVGGREFLTLQRSRLRHGFPQAVKGKRSQCGEQYEHALPRRYVDQRGTGQRPQQRGNQRYVGHQRGDFDAHRLFKRLLDGGVTHCADKAQANPLQETHKDKLFDAGHQQNSQTGDDKKRHAGQHNRATPAPIRQRPQQPLQENTAGQIGGH